MRKKDDARIEHITFEHLIDSIHRIHTRLASQASRAVNVSLTMRNWLIGLYIDEFELRGADRARYGENLLPELAGRLTGLKISNCGRRQLYRYLRFYRLYPAIVGTLSPQLRQLLPGQISSEAKVGTLSTQLQIPAETVDCHAIFPKYCQGILSSVDP